VKELTRIKIALDLETDTRCGEAPSFTEIEQKKKVNLTPSCPSDMHSLTSSLDDVASRLLAHGTGKLAAILRSRNVTRTARTTKSIGGDRRGTTRVSDAVIARKNEMGHWVKVLAAASERASLPLISDQYGRRASSLPRVRFASFLLARPLSAS